MQDANRDRFRASVSARLYEFCEELTQPHEPVHPVRYGPQTDRAATGALPPARLSQTLLNIICSHRLLNGTALT